MFSQNGSATPSVLETEDDAPKVTRSTPVQTLTLTTEAIATLLDVAEATEERAQSRADDAKAELKAANDELLEATRNATVLRDQLSGMESGDTVTATFN